MLGEPIRDRRLERHEATKAEIVAAAWELAREQGLAGLSLRDLARRVGMQAPSLYSYFESKNAIYDAMFAEGCQASLDRFEQLEFSGDPLDDLRTILGSFVDFCTADPVRYQLLFQRTIPGFEPSPESFAISIESLDRVRRLLTEMGFDEPEVLDLYTAVGTGLTDQQISNDPGGDRWTRLVDEAAEMFFNHIRDRSKKRPKRGGNRR